MKEQIISAANPKLDRRFFGDFYMQSQLLVRPSEVQAFFLARIWHIVLHCTVFN